MKHHLLLYECVCAQNTWNQLRLYLAEKIDLPVLTPQTVVFALVDVRDQNSTNLYFQYSSTICTTQTPIII